VEALKVAEGIVLTGGGAAADRMIGASADGARAACARTAKAGIIGIGVASSDAAVAVESTGVAATVPGFAVGATSAAPDGGVAALGSAGGDRAASGVTPVDPIGLRVVGGNVVPVGIAETVGAVLGTA